MPFRVHAAMKDADNFDGIGGHLTVENDMASGAVFAVAILNVATIPAFEGFLGQVLKMRVQHRQILVPLRPSPFALGIAANVFQIGLGLMALT